MSRRYGRKQKWAHKARIAELERDVAYFHRQMDALEKEKRRWQTLYESLAESVRDVAKHSAMLPPEEGPAYFGSRTHVQIPLTARRGMPPPWSDLRLAEEEIFRLQAFVHDNPHLFQTELHVRLVGASTALAGAYAVTRSALANLHRNPGARAAIEHGMRGLLHSLYAKLPELRATEARAKRP